ncbi:MAG: hypothetical protein WEB53_04165 [Akkermansiaceae bacterium]
MVEVRKRFLAIDVSGDFDVVIDPETQIETQGDPIPVGFVTQEEIKAYRALETKPKSTLTKFELADFDGDGVLDPIEFRHLVSPKVPIKNTDRQFKRLDLDKSLLLTKSEFRKIKALDL